MSVNIRLFILLGVFGVFVHQPAMGQQQSVAPVTAPQPNQEGVSEKIGRGVIRLDGDVASPIDNILGSGIKLPPQMGDTQPTPAAAPIEVPAAAPGKAAPVTDDPYGK